MPLAPYTRALQHVLGSHRGVEEARSEGTLLLSVEDVAAVIANSLSASELGTSPAAIASAVLLAAKAGLDAMPVENARARRDAMQMLVVLGLLMPVAQASGRSLGELDLLHERCDRNLTTRIMVTVRPGHEFPVEITGLGSFNVPPEAGPHAA